ncbi:TPA: hypothetical protein ACMDV3_001730 [Vibrio parahaemolyticus]
MTDKQTSHLVSKPEVENVFLSLAEAVDAELKHLGKALRLGVSRKFRATIFSKSIK